MPNNYNTSRKFRVALKREIPILIESGILTTEGKDKLSSQYELDIVFKKMNFVLTAVGGVSE